ERWLACSDYIPSGCNQVDRFAKRRDLHWPVGIVCEERLPGGTQCPVDHPVVTALVVRERYRTDGGYVIADDCGGDAAQVESFRRIESAERIWRHVLLNRIKAKAADV